MLPPVTRLQLQPSSYQWSCVDFQLQLITGKSSLKLLSIYKYTDPSSTYLDYKSTHTSIINITDYSKEYSDKFITKTLSLQDVIFKCGHVNIQKYLGNQHKVITFLICKVHLGKIGSIKDKDVSSCDSIFIQTQVTNTDQTNSVVYEQDINQFNYFIRTASQYTIQYQVSFIPSEQKQFKIQQYQCSNCQNRVPTVFCHQQNLLFCDNCSIDHHKSKLMSIHQIQSVNKVNTLGQCQTHKQGGNKLEYYCLKCMKYFCVQCIQKGLHFQNVEHPVKHIGLYYQELHTNVQNISRKPKIKLDNLLSNLNIKRKQIDQNYQSIKQQLKKKYQGCLSILQQIYYQKYQFLSSFQIQMRMLNQRIQWSRAFIMFEQKNLKPSYYFDSQKKQLLFKKQYLQVLTINEQIQNI